MKELFICENCGCRRYLDIEGSGADEYGNFSDYWCEDCEQLTRMYDSKEG